MKNLDYCILNAVTSTGRIHLETRKESEKYFFFKNLVFRFKEVAQIFSLSPKRVRESMGELLKSQLQLCREEMKELRDREKKPERIMILLFSSKFILANQRRNVMKSVSERIKRMTHEEVLECTRNIPADDYLDTVALVEEEAQTSID